METPMVLIDEASLCYRMPQEQYSGMKEFAIRWLQRRVHYYELWALNEVDLVVNTSEVIGIVGRNGAGKSTLLKLIARVLHPTSGRVRVNGSTAPLLGLGAGFHPELTGRENIFLYGAMLGLTRREMEQYVNSIIEFSELNDFIDSPLRTYSGGMYLRLGFAVATCRFSDVLLVDEVLAVGDAKFQSKCIDRMKGFRAAGSSIIYVSHDLGSIESICDRVIWLEQGQIKLDGPPKEVISSYLDFVSQENLYSSVIQPSNNEI
jgi:ABC-type polysaccharide/polyol phosphate transport system ATPase subunit